jgi:hypothetical protein
LIPTKTAEVDSTISGLETQSFTIQVTAKSFRVLLDDMYTDKPQSIVRELWTNALDSHTRAGVEDQPFHCTLPSQFSPTFSVRDYGTSMTHDEVMHLYSTVFATSKDETNTETGCLGLGSKVVFAYSDSFTAIAYSGTEKRVYLASLDNNAIPSITHLSTEPSGDPRGFEVTFPVQQHHTSEFQTAARRVALGFDVLPTTPGVDLQVPEPTFSTEGFRIYKSSDLGYNKGYVRQGPVVYPIPTDLLDKQRGNRLHYNFKFIIDVPLGTVDFAASREALQLTENTSKVLLQLITEYHNRLAETALEDVKEASSFIIAAQRYGAWTEYLPDLDGVKVHGRELNRNTMRYLQVMANGPFPKLFRLKTEKATSLERIDPNKKGRDSSYSFSIAALPSMKFVIYNGKPLVRKRLRFKEFAKHDHWNTYWLEEPTGKEISRMMRLMGLERSQFINAHDLPDVEPEVRAKSASAGDGMQGMHFLIPNSDGAFSAIKPDTLPTDYYWLAIDRAADAADVRLPELRRTFRFDQRRAALKQYQYLIDRWETARPIILLTPRALKRLNPPQDRRFDVFVKKLLEDNAAEIAPMLAAPTEAELGYGSVARELMKSLRPANYDKHIVEVIKYMNIKELTDAVAEREAVVEGFKEKYPMLFSPSNEQIKQYMTIMDTLESEK